MATATHTNMDEHSHDVINDASHNAGANAGSNEGYDGGHDASHDASHDAGQVEPESDIVCGICYERISVESAIAACPNHCLCTSCIQRMIGDAAKSEINYPPRCCGTTIIALADVEHVLEPSVVSLYKEKKIQYDTEPRNRTFCRSPQCGVFLEHASQPTGSSTTEAHCHSCGLFTCTLCKELLPHTCKGEVTPAPSLSYSTSNRCKPCPFCRTALWLAEACNHMTCGVCKGEFCFICLLPSEDTNDIPEIHRCPQYGDPTYDEEGYDLRGFHRDTGYDRDGYNLLGLNAAGHNRQGGIDPIYYRGRRKQRTQPLNELSLDEAELTDDMIVHLIQETEQGRFARSDVIPDVQAEYNDEEDEFEDPLMDDPNITANNAWADYPHADDYGDTTDGQQWNDMDEGSWTNPEVIDSEGLQDSWANYGHPSQDPDSPSSWGRAHPDDRPYQPPVYVPPPPITTPPTCEQAHCNHDDRFKFRHEYVGHNTGVRCQICNWDAPVFFLECNTCKIQVCRDCSHDYQYQLQKFWPGAETYGIDLLHERMEQEQMDREQREAAQVELVESSQDVLDIPLREDSKDSGFLGIHRLGSALGLFFTPFGRIISKV